MDVTTRQSALAIVFFGGRLREGGQVVTSNETWELDAGGWMQLRPGR